MSRNDRTRGFTLVELLIGLTLLLVAVTAVHTSLSLGLRARKGARERTERLQTVRTLTARLRDDIRNLIWIGPALALDETTLVMLRHATNPITDAPIVRVRYHVERDYEQGITCTRESAVVEWNGDTVFDPEIALGWDQPDGEGGWVGESPEVPLVVRGLTALRWHALHFEEGDFVEGSVGVQSELDAVRIEFELSETETEKADHGFTLRLLPRTLP